MPPVCAVRVGGRTLREVILYHFTRAADWPAIAAVGELRPMWPASLEGLRCPRTAHFTSSPDPAALPDALQDRRVRLRVDVPEADAYAWRPWLTRNMPPENQWTLGADRPGNGAPATWYVTERAVTAREWGEAVNLDTRARLWPPVPR